MFAGLRPEAFGLAATGEKTVELRLTAVEALGHEQLLYFDVSELSMSNMVVRVQGSPMVSIGGKIPLSIDIRELYFFDVQGDAIY